MRQEKRPTSVINIIYETNDALYSKKYPVKDRRQGSKDGNNLVWSHICAKGKLTGGGLLQSTSVGS